jgi:hypothetical protein
VDRRTRISHPKSSDLLPKLRNGFIRLDEIFHNFHHMPLSHFGHLIGDFLTPRLWFPPIARLKFLPGRLMGIRRWTARGQLNSSPPRVVRLPQRFRGGSPDGFPIPFSIRNCQHSLTSELETITGSNDDRGSIFCFLHFYFIFNQISYA